MTPLAELLCHWLAVLLRHSSIQMTPCTIQRTGIAGKPERTNSTCYWLTKCLHQYRSRDSFAGQRIGQVTCVCFFDSSWSIWTHYESLKLRPRTQPHNATCRCVNGVQHRDEACSVVTQPLWDGRRPQFVHELWFCGNSGSRALCVILLNQTSAERRP